MTQARSVAELIKENSQLHTCHFASTLKGLLFASDLDFQCASAERGGGGSVPLTAASLNFLIKTDGKHIP